MNVDATFPYLRHRESKREISSLPMENLSIRKRHLAFFYNGASTAILFLKSCVCVTFPVSHNIGTNNGGIDSRFDVVSLNVNIFPSC